MNSIKTDGKCTEEIPYPKLMIYKNTGSVFLMSSRSTGTRVHSSNKLRLGLGEIIKSLDRDLLLDFHGSICLEN